MNLQDAINASDYSTASHAENGVETTVDGSIGNGFYITEAYEGMPVHHTDHVATLEGAINLVKELNIVGEWEPVGEAES